MTWIVGLAHHEPRTNQINMLVSSEMELGCFDSMLSHREPYQESFVHGAWHGPEGSRWPQARKRDS